MDSNHQSRLYFARPACSCGSDAENRGLYYLKKLHPHHEIVSSSATGTKLAPFAELYVYMPYHDGKIDATIGKEIQQRLKTRREVHEMHVNVEGVPIPMVSNITRLDAERVLTPEESAARTMPQHSIDSRRR